MGVIEQVIITVYMENNQQIIFLIVARSTHDDNNLTIDSTKTSTTHKSTHYK